MYKEDLALNNLQGVVHHKTQPKQTFVYWHINFPVLFNAKTIIVKELRWYYSTHYLENKGFYIFPKDISPNIYIYTTIIK